MRPSLFNRAVPWHSISSQLPHSLFKVTSKRGFLPTSIPLKDSGYKYVDKIMHQLPIIKTDGARGLLGQGVFCQTVHKQLPELNFDHQQDVKVLSALLRDYMFLSCAYMQEPVYKAFVEENQEILNNPSDKRTKKLKIPKVRSNSIVPRNIAVPLASLAQRLGSPQYYLDYSFGYNLGNFTLWNENQPAYNIDNINVSRMFHGGRDQKGFIAVHLAIDAHTYKLVQAIEKMFFARKIDNRSEFNAQLQNINSFMDTIMKVFRKMWVQSQPRNFAKFRIFFSGIQGNKDSFPNGVIYQGVSDQPFYWRGPSAAQNSIVPTIDAVLETKYPQNELSKSLAESQSLRPIQQRAYTSWVKSNAKILGIRNYAAQDNKSIVLYLKSLDWLRLFRKRHWIVTKGYIINQSDDTKGTGGTPITTWLPNQLLSTLHNMAEICDIAYENNIFEQEIEAFREDVNSQIATLTKQVRQLHQAYNTNVRGDEEELGMFKVRN